MGWLRNLIIKKGNDTYTYTDTFNTWEYNKSGTTHTLTGPTFNNWTFFTASGSNAGAYCKGGSITILESEGTVDNYPLYVTQKNNIKYYTPFVLSSCVPSYSAPTAELNGDFNNLYLKLSCPGKAFYAKYGNIDIFINKSMKMRFNSIQNVSVSNNWNGSYWSLFTKASAIRSLGPSLLYEYQTVYDVTSSCACFPSWRGFQTLANANYNSYKRIACVNIQNINTSIIYFTNAHCTSTNSASWTTSINTAVISYYDDSSNVSYAIDGIYHTISIPNYTPSRYSYSAINYMAYQNETQQGSSKLNFYGTDLTYNKTDSDTMTVHWHPRCGLCSSSEDIRFSGENMSWNAFSAKDWTLTISKDNYVLADYNNSLGDDYEKLGGYSLWNISSEVSSYSISTSDYSKTFYIFVNDSQIWSGTIRSTYQSGYNSLTFQYASTSLGTGIHLYGRRNGSSSYGELYLVVSTSSTTFKVGYRSQVPYFNWDSKQTPFSWINNHFNASSQMILYRQGKYLIANTPSPTKLVTSAFTDNTFTNGTYKVTFAFNGYVEYGQSNDNCGNARFIQTYELTVSSNSIALSPTNINT